MSKTFLVMHLKPLTIFWLGTSYILTPSVLEIVIMLLLKWLYQLSHIKYPADNLKTGIFSCFIIIHNTYMRLNCKKIIVAWKKEYMFSVFPFCIHVLFGWCLEPALSLDLQTSWKKIWKVKCFPKLKMVCTWSALSYLH